MSDVAPSLPKNQAHTNSFELGSESATGSPIRPLAWERIVWVVLGAKSSKISYRISYRNSILAYILLIFKNMYGGDDGARTEQGAGAC